MPVRTPYRPTGKPANRDVATHSREIGRAFQVVTKQVNEVQAAVAAAQAAADAAGADDRPNVVRTIDFRLEPSSTPVTGGTHTIDGDAWEIEGIGVGDTMEIVAGTGITFACRAASTALNTTSQTCMYLRIKVREIIPDYDPTRRYIYQLLVGDHTADAGNNQVCLALWNDSTDGPSSGEHICQAISGIQAGTQGAGARADVAAAVLHTDFPFSSGWNTIGVTADPGNPGSFACTVGQGVGSSWPAADGMRSCGWGCISATVASNSQPHYSDSEAYITIATPTGESSGTFTATIQALRIIEA